MQPWRSLEVDLNPDSSSLVAYGITRRGMLDDVDNKKGVSDDDE